jgi:hypothetical protein
MENDDHIALLRSFRTPSDHYGVAGAGAVLA